MAGTVIVLRAVESAIQLTRRGGERERTCLVDLDFTNEACADFLDLEPRLDLAEVGPRGTQFEPGSQAVLLGDTELEEGQVEQDDAQER